ncbi:MAG: histidine phosphatase family protein [Nitriliruptor sp.]|uniref:histidine phosphatase family protein n=1 Tax=Nitriliruptor sp. TaxID=2448056 RepID=UPI00349FFF4C
MATILLVRHGQASFGAADYDVLSETGQRQAAIVAERLAMLTDVRQVVRGALVRQRDTAAPLLERLGTAAVEDARFDEYDHVELVRQVLDDPAQLPAEARQDDPRRAFQAVLEHALARWIAGDHGADQESFAAFRARVRGAVVDLADGLSGTAVVVTSGGVISAVCADALGLEPRGWARLNTVIVNSSITKLVVGRRGTTLVSVNDHAHLEPHGRELLTYR